jgi:hypothetical protein
LKGEIQRNCDLALLAYKDIKKSLELIKPDDKDIIDRFWLSVESFLVAVANTSKILWPSTICGSVLSEEVSLRREFLRGILSVDESSPIKSKAFRNHFEHYDSRIEEWSKEYENKTIIDSNIGSTDPIIAGTGSQVFYMRNFDPHKFILRIRGSEYDINQVATAIEELLNRTKTAKLIF